MFTSVFTTVVHQCLSQARYIHSMSLNFMFLEHILMLQFQLRPDLPRSLFRLGFPTKMLHACLFSRMHTTYVASLILPDLIDRKFWRGVQITKLFDMQLQPVSWYLLLVRSIHIPQNPIHKHSLCSSLNVRDQTAHPYKQQSKLHFCIS